MIRVRWRTRRRRRVWIRNTRARGTDAPSRYRRWGDTSRRRRSTTRSSATSRTTRASKQRRRRRGKTASGTGAGGAGAGGAGASGTGASGAGASGTGASGRAEGCDAFGGFAFGGFAFGGFAFGGFAFGVFSIARRPSPDGCFVYRREISGLRRVLVSRVERGDRGESRGGGGARVGAETRVEAAHGDGARTRVQVASRRSPSRSPSSCLGCLTMSSRAW